MRFNCIYDIHMYRPSAYNTYALKSVSTLDSVKSNREIKASYHTNRMYYVGLCVGMGPFAPPLLFGQIGFWENQVHDTRFIMKNPSLIKLAILGPQWAMNIHRFCDTRNAHQINHLMCLMFLHYGIVVVFFFFGLTFIPVHRLSFSIFYAAVMLPIDQPYLQWGASLHHHQNRGNGMYKFVLWIELY